MVIFAGDRYLKYSNTRCPGFLLSPVFLRTSPATIGHSFNLFTRSSRLGGSHVTSSMRLNMLGTTAYQQKV